MSYGAFMQFRLTNDKSEVINGNYSGLLTFDDAQYSSYYFEVLTTNSKYFSIQGEKTYKVSMKYKLIDYDDDSSFYFVFTGPNTYKTYIEHSLGNNDGVLNITDLGDYKLLEWVITLDLPGRL